MKLYEISDYEAAKRYIEKKETDQLIFSHEGFECEIKRHDSLGHLCGYIKSSYQPLKRKAEEHFHCGVTYDTGGIIGFDCAHSGDMSPRIVELTGRLPENTLWNDTYKTMHYVENCLRETIDSLKEE